jgi:hypothetical protein
MKKFTSSCLALLAALVSTAALAQVNTPPLTGAAPRAPSAPRCRGLYVSVTDGAISLTTQGGTSNFTAGQFGYTARRPSRRSSCQKTPLSSSRRLRRSTAISPPATQAPATKPPPLTAKCAEPKALRHPLKPLFRKKQGLFHSCAGGERGPNEYLGRTGEALPLRRCAFAAFAQESTRTTGGSL